MLVTERAKNTEKRLSTVKDELKKSRQKLESTTKDRNEAEQKNTKAKENLTRIREIKAGYQDIVKMSTERMKMFTTE